MLFHFETKYFFNNQIYQTFFTVQINLRDDIPRKLVANSLTPGAHQHHNTRAFISCSLGPLDVQCKFKHNQVGCRHLCEFRLNLGRSLATVNCLYQKEMYTLLVMISRPQAIA